MKKYFIFISIIMLLNGVSYGEDIQNSRVINPDDVIFRSSLTDIVQDLSDTSEEYNDYADFGDAEGSMPFFKQMRLGISNFYYKRAANKKKINIKIPKFAFLHKNKEEVNREEFKSNLTETIEQETALNTSETSLSFETGINEEVTEKQLMLDASQIDFNEDTGEMVATGEPKLYFPQQNTTVVADKMTYNDDGNILKGFGHIVVNKDGKPVTGDYLEIDMNEESMLMDNMLAASETMNTKAKQAVLQDGMIILTDGNLFSDKDSISRIASRMVGPRFQDMMIDPAAETLFFGNPEKDKLKLHIESIDLDARKNHDVVKLKNIEFYNGDKYLFRWPSLTAYTNKERTYFEGNYPEFGSRRKAGMFIGPGFVFGGPAGSVVKFIPFINYKKEIGFGGMLKYINTFNKTELGYASANDIFFLRGKQQLDNHLFLHYAANSYTDEWFLGGRMAKYMAEAYYDRAYLNKDFFGNGRDLTFRHRAGFGLMEDDDRSYNGEKFGDVTNMSTTRTRYMAEISQKVYEYKNEEDRISFDANVVMQGSAALYGTGDTQFVARLGPVFKVQYKNWMQQIGYYLTGYDDKSPMPRYDAYRYGRQSVHIMEAFRVCKYASVGWSGYVNLSDDSPNGKMFQENAFLVSLGPDDFKIILGYDFVRQRTYFGFNVAFNSKGTNIDYDKMIIKNPEMLGKQDKNEQEVAFVRSPDVVEENSQGLFGKPAQKKQIQVLEYAQVIDIEDPNKETIE